jgi:3-hydroxybutyryl-CoA dehydrogenase
MGAGIAQVAAVGGHAVLLADAQPAATARARASIEKVMQRDVEKGRRTREDADAVLQRLTYIDGVDETRLAPFADCGFVIEAIVEQLTAKQALFATLENIVPEATILASNTSSLSIAALGGACRHPWRVVGVHFFNPAPLMPLVEIIPAISTAPEIVLAATSLMQSWGKTTVAAKDVPGFIVNRVARSFYGESLRIVEEGIADVATVDWAMTALGGFRMGPFTLMDLIGNDVNSAVSRTVYENTFHDARYRPSVLQQRYAEAGWLGRKSGRGFYGYGEGSDQPAPTEDPVLGQVIVRRVLAMLINEAVDAVDMQFASVHDIEVAMTTGVNYPKGLLAWGDEIGPANVLAEIERLQREYSDPRYRPSRRLRAIVERGGSLLDPTRT